MFCRKWFPSRSGCDLPLKKVVHIITDLNPGGAEMMLLKLMKVLVPRKRYEYHIISMMDLGTIGQELLKLGIEVHMLNMSRRSGFIRALLKAIKICNGASVIQTWMYHADLLGFFVKMNNINAKLIWGIRQSNLDPVMNTPRTLKIIRLNALLSKTKWVNGIVTNSIEAKKTHISAGYHPGKFILIPNGFDVSAFKAVSRSTARMTLGIREGDFLVVTVGRWDVQKGYDVLISGLKMALKEIQNVTLLLAGTGLDTQNVELRRLIFQNDVTDHVVLVGRRDDICTVLSAGNLYVSSSYGEGFSNAIGEAMACGLPCIVTDAGDSAILVGEEGFVIPRGDPSAVADAIVGLAKRDEAERSRIGLQLRQRIIHNYGIESVTDQYESLYKCDCR